MKKLIALLALLVTVSLNAATLTATVPSATSTNIPFLLGTNSQALITGVIVVSTNNNVATVNFVDSYWKTFQITNQAYQVINSYATNYITLYTNYYGATNSFTNLALIEVTNTVATNNILLGPVFTTFAGTNSSTTYQNLALKINQGLWLTNTTAASDARVTITYTQ